MVDYEVTVFAANHANATTLNNVYIKLVGTDGESKRSRLTGFKMASTLRRTVPSFTVSCTASIGKLVLIELNKRCPPLFPKDSWFPAKVMVKSPEGHTYNFPIYHWIDDSEVHCFREGTAQRVFEDKYHCGKQSREQELKKRQEEYLLAELKLKALADSKNKWTHIDAISQVFSCKQTDISDYVQQHWKEDAFFGYQFLNGVNPMLIRRCTALPSNFPVTDDMVFPSGQCNLADELKITVSLLK